MLEDRLIFKFDLVTKVLFLVSALLLSVNIVTVFSFEQEQEDDGELEIYKQYCEDSGGNLTQYGCEHNGYQFTKCPNDSNSYPEGTNCNELNNIDDDENSDSEEATEQEEKAMAKEDD